MKSRTHLNITYITEHLNKVLCDFFQYMVIECRRISPCFNNEDIRRLLSFVVQIVYYVAEPELKADGNIMGIDLGIKCPAVSYCSDGSVKFYGNGHRNKVDKSTEVP